MLVYGVVQITKDHSDYGMKGGGISPHQARHQPRLKVTLKWLPFLVCRNRPFGGSVLSIRKPSIMIAVPAAVRLPNDRLMPAVVIYHGHRKVATVYDKGGKDRPNFTYQGGAIGWAKGWFERHITRFNRSTNPANDD